MTTPRSTARPRAEAPHGAAGSMTRAMQAGLHLIGLALVLVAVSRSISGGAAPARVITVGALFLTWYAVGPLLGSRMRSAAAVYSWVGTLAAIWILSITASAEFIWVAFLLWLLAGRFLRLRSAILFSAIVFALVCYAPIFHNGAVDYARIFGPLIGAVFAVGISRGYLQLLNDAAEREQLVESLTRTQAELLDLQDELALTQRHAGMETERTRIARDIHDTIAQTLPSVRLLAHAAAASSEPDEAGRALAQIESLAADGITDVRRIVSALAPAELDQGALGAALARMLERLSSDITIQTDLMVDDDMPRLPSRIEVALLRTAQSALANVRQHAGATRVAVSLIDDSGSVRLDIIDNGRGFSPEQAGRAADSRSGYGLGFIQSRLRELGGGLDIKSSPGEGTELSAHLPLPSGLGKAPPDQEQP